MTKKAIFPGTFDPPTLGHLDIISRSATIFDHLIVGVGHNQKKITPIFTPQEREKLLKKITKKFANVEVCLFDGLLVDFAKEKGVKTIVRSIRNTLDFEYETLQAHMNRELGDIETLYMVASDKYRFISSTLIRDIAKFRKDLSSFIPPEIESDIYNKIAL